MSCRLLAIAVCAVAISGCNTVDKNIGTQAPLLGEAVAYNAAVQTINPDPVYAQNGLQPGGLGSHGVAAMQRYRKDQVTARHRQEVNAMRTSSLQTTTGSNVGSQ